MAQTLSEMLKSHLGSNPVECGHDGSKGLTIINDHDDLAFLIDKLGLAADATAVIPCSACLLSLPSYASSASSRYTGAMHVTEHDEGETDHGDYLVRKSYDQGYGRGPDNTGDSWVSVVRKSDGKTVARYSRQWGQYFSSSMAHVDRADGATWNASSLPHSGRNVRTEFRRQVLKELGVSIGR